MSAICFIISFLASVAGAICGIGGGVIIKPVLDLFGVASVAAISCLSGCTLLAMSCYSVGRNLAAGESRVDFAVGTPLALGAAVGGVLGKQLFSVIRSAFARPDTVGCVQAACLAVITALTFLYTLKKAGIRTRHVTGRAACAAIGLVLGVMSSFLGIGGGPINLVVLFYFFSMDTKTAAQNSLYVILFSQAASLITTLVTRTVPEFQPLTLVLMAAGGIGGGMVGRSLNRRMSAAMVDRLFLCLMGVIIAISLYNIWRYLPR